VLIEVLSDATRDYDRGEKFELYKTIPTLREYVLIDQQRIVVDHFTRGRDSWIESSTASLSSKISLRSLKVDLSVREVYRGVA
jgi:Uma2 family endonuclease